MNGVIVACLYAPNGNPKPGPKFEYKLAWLKRLRTHARFLHTTGLPIILAGDFNVAPTDLDLYPTTSWNDDALVDPEARALMKSLIGRSWLDCLRSQHPDEPIYTFWDYRRLRFERNAGLRIDHILASRSLWARLLESGVDRWVRASPGASDHAPVWAVIS